MTRYLDEAGLKEYHDKFKAKIDNELEKKYSADNPPPPYTLNETDKESIIEAVLESYPAAEEARF